MKPHDPMTQEEYRAALVTLYGANVKGNPVKGASSKLAYRIGMSRSRASKASSGVLELDGPAAHSIRLLVDLKGVTG